jgi:hypothetical protein
MSHVIRLAGLEDRPAVEAIVQSAYAPYLPRIGRKPGPMLDDYAARIDAGQVHVIESDGAIHGILVLIPRQGSMLLDNIAVRPGAQGWAMAGSFWSSRSEPRAMRDMSRSGFIRTRP